MPRDVLPEQLITPSRDEIVRRYERDWLLRAVGAKVGPSTEPGIKARLVADIVLPIYGESARNAQIASLTDMDAGQLEDEAAKLGIPRRLPAVGASGALVALTSAGGGQVFAGDEYRDELSGFRYRCSTTATYVTGDQIPIAGFDTGRGTNAPVGRTLTATVQRPGVAQKLLVAQQNNGEGLTGGRDSESVDELIVRIQDARANPAVAGNDAAYRKACIETPGVAVQAAFTYPAIDGPGTTGLAFTLRPATPGASRIPNATQIAAVRANIVGQFPKDDGLYDITPIANPVSVRLRVQWAAAAKGWTDAAPWPAYHATQPVYVSVATSPTVFTLTTAQASPVAPQPGQTIAFYNAATGAFARKKIAPGGVSGANPWVITCDTTNAASETTFAPAVNDRVCPWSDSLDSLVAPTIAQFEGFGPGEMFAAFFDEGLRQKRTPESPASWPSVITGRVVTPLYALAPVGEVAFEDPALPFDAPLGTPKVSVYLHELASLLAFPL